MIAHLGKNPVSWGSPPVDRRLSEVWGNAIGILLFHVGDVEVIDVNEWK